MSPKLLPALLAPLFLIGACAGTGDEAVRLESGADAIALLQAAPEAVAEAGSARFEMTVSVDGGAEGELSFLATGAFDTAAQRLQLELDLGEALAGLDPEGMGLPGLDEPMEVIVDGATTYVRIPFLSSMTGTSGWLSASAEDLGASADQLGFGAGTTDPSQLLEALRGVADDVEAAGQEDVRGVPTTRYTATVDLDAAADVVPADQRERFEAELHALGDLGALPVEVWIDADGLVRRLVLDVSGVAPQGQLPGKAQIAMELFDYGEPVEIDLPPADQVVPFTEAFGAFGGLLGPTAEEGS